MNFTHSLSMLPAVLTVFLFAISAVCARQTSRLLGGVTANALRLTLAVCLLGLWAHTFGGGLSGHSLFWFFISGAVGFGLGDIALFQALPRLGSRLTILIVQCLAAPIAVVTEWIWMGTPMSIIAMMMASVILTGVAIALKPSSSSATPQISTAGICFGLLAAAGQAWGAVISRKAYAIASAHHEIIDGATAAYQRGLAGIMVAWIVWGIVKSFPTLSSWDRPSPIDTSISLKKIPISAWVVINSLAGPTLGVACYQWALSTAPSGWVLPIVATSPLAVIPLAWWIEKERPSPQSLWGGVLAVIGVIGLVMSV